MQFFYIYIYTNFEKVRLKCLIQAVILPQKSCTFEKQVYALAWTKRQTNIQPGGTRSSESCESNFLAPFRHGCVARALVWFPHICVL